MAGTPPSYLALIRDNRAFRLLWLGEVVSFLGDWFASIALYTVVYELTGSAKAVAAVLVAHTLPNFLVMPIAGPIVDRYDRRTIMIATDLVRALCVIGLVVAIMRSDVVLLFAVLLVKVSCTGIFFPARTAAIPQVTDPDSVPVAMALSGGTWSVMAAVGGAAGGLAVAFLGVLGALWVDVATYLLSAALLWAMPRLPAEGGATDASTGFIDGLRYLRRDSYVASLVWLKPGLCLSGAAVAMIPLFGEGVFPAAAGPLFVGLLFSMRGVGALIGSLGIRRLFGDARQTMHWAIVAGFCGIAVGYLGSSVAPSFWLAGLGYFVAAIGVAVIWVFSGTLIQVSAEPAYRGRVFSLEFGIAMVVMAMASWSGGVLVDWGVDERTVVAGAGLVALPAALLWTTQVLRLGGLERELRSEDPQRGE